MFLPYLSNNYPTATTIAITTAPQNPVALGATVQYASTRCASKGSI